MSPQVVSLRRALSDPGLLGAVLAGESWHAWRSILLAAMGEPLEPDELDVFRRLTGRHVPPDSRVEELVVVAGRRGGKSSAIAALAVYLAALCDYRGKLAPGERAVVLCIAPDTKQARIALDYATGLMEATPVLAQLIAGRTADALELTTGVAIEVRSASFRRLRGLTCAAVIADEACYWLADEGSHNPDREILAAARPCLATLRGPIFIISSPYARKGEVWETYRKHYGPDGDPLILVAQGSSKDFNPSLSQSVIDRAYERDAPSAAAEFGGQFRTDIENFISLEIVRSCIEPGCRERPPNRQHKYVGFVDPSGGSSDSMTLAVAHAEGPREQRTAVLDCVKEFRPPFSPEAVCQEFADTLRRYRVVKIKGDRYGGEWCVEGFRRHGIIYEPSDRSRSELYIDCLPLLTSRAADLIDDDRLVNQLVALERRTSRGGRDLVDHRVGAHDDLANAVAGALVLAMTSRGSSALRHENFVPPPVHIGYADFKRKHRWADRAAKGTQVARSPSARMARATASSQNDFARAQISDRAAPSPHHGRADEVCPAAADDAHARASACR
jgi:hypothetical protein